MKITVCGSMTNYGRMIQLREKLESLGHRVFLPDPADCEHLEKLANGKYVDTYRLKKKYNYINQHYKNILKSDCVLLANYDKNGIMYYVGGNSFLEMGFAFVNKKPIYMVNPVPQISFYYHEMKAMDPIVVGDKLKAFEENGKI